MKLKLDENLPFDLATMLREIGHDVEDIVAEGLGGKSDPTVFEAATDEKRVLLTFDMDFADIRRFPPEGHHGIIVFRLQDQRWPSLLKAVRLVLERQILVESAEVGLVIVSESRIRQRRPKKR